MKFSKTANRALIAACALMLGLFTGCWKNSGEAVVEEKEYIAAGEELGTPRSAPAISPAEPDATPSVIEEEAAKPLAEDEIVVEGYVMKKEVRGTSKDPRAHPGLEQWRINVRMVEGGRAFTVRATRPQFERLKVGDRVKVRYREGKYTGTVWSAEIVD